MYNDNFPRSLNIDKKEITDTKIIPQLFYLRGI